jgi:hypothetical protein
MQRKQILGFLIGASLMVGFEPVAEAMPAAMPGNAAEAAISDGLVMQAVTRAGVVHRSTRRTARRVTRRHY